MVRNSHKGFQALVDRDKKTQEQVMVDRGDKTQG